MKRIDAVVRPEKFEQVKKALVSARCPGMMVFTFKGHGRRGGADEIPNSRRFKIDQLPKVLLTIFANNTDVERLVKAVLTGARTGRPGDGKIFISSLITAFRVRTGEKGSRVL